VGVGRRRRRRRRKEEEEERRRRNLFKAKSGGQGREGEGVQGWRRGSIARVWLLIPFGSSKVFS